MDQTVFLSHWFGGVAIFCLHLLGYMWKQKKTRKLGQANESQEN